MLNAGANFTISTFRPESSCNLTARFYNYWNIVFIIMSIGKAKVAYWRGFLKDACNLHISKDVELGEQHNALPLFSN